MTSSTYEFKKEKLKMLVYGQPGVGKTRLVATASADPRLAPVLMLEAFGNPISIRGYKEKPDIVTVHDMADFNEPYDWLTTGQDPKHPFCQQFGLKPPYKTIIVDSLTEVQRMVIRRITGQNFIGPGDPTPAMQRQGFGQLMGSMLNWAVCFLGLDMNVILTSHEAERQEVAGGIVYKKPLLWGQGGNELAGYCYMVMRLQTALSAEPWTRTIPDNPVTDATQTIGWFCETTKHYAKDQYGIRTDHIIDPTMTEVMNLIEQSIDL